MGFSIVIPIAERDVSLVRRTLPSWLALGSDDVVLSVDKPASQELLRAIASASSTPDVPSRVRIVEHERSEGWKFNQAGARREGFEHAAHDAILTGDIDLIVRKNVVDLTRRVGSNNIGLASCLRVPAPLSPAQLLRAYSFLFKQKLIPPIFSGLYAVWRPYWRETEDEGIRRLENPGRVPSSAAGPGIVGEDTYLFICMRRKYACLNLNRIGAISLTRNVEDLPNEQFAWGRYLAGLDLNPVAAILTSIAFAYPFFLRGYLYQRGGSRKFVDPFSSEFRL